MVLGQGMVLGSSELRSGSLEHGAHSAAAKAAFLKWGRPTPLTFAGVPWCSACYTRGVLRAGAACSTGWIRSSLSAWNSPHIRLRRFRSLGIYW